MTQELLRTALIALFMASSVSSQAVETRPLPPDERGHFGISFDVMEQGFLLTHVRAGSPAEDAGVREGDLLISLNGSSLAGLDLVDGLDRIHAFRTGETVRLELLRGDQHLTVALKLVERPPDLEDDSEGLERLRRMRNEDRALSQLIRIAERAPVFEIRRSNDGVVRLRPLAAGATWERAWPRLVEILDRTLDGKVSRLKMGSTLRVEGRLGENGLDLEVME